MSFFILSRSRASFSVLLVSHSPQHPAPLLPPRRVVLSSLHLQSRTLALLLLIHASLPRRIPRCASLTADEDIGGRRRRRGPGDGVGGGAATTSEAWRAQAETCATGAGCEEGRYGSAKHATGTHSCWRADLCLATNATHRHRRRRRPGCRPASSACSCNVTPPRATRSTRGVERQSHMHEMLNRMRCFVCVLAERCGRKTRESVLSGTTLRCAHLPAPGRFWLR